MNDTTIIVLVSIAVSVIAAIWAVLKWNSRRSINFLLRGIGIILMVVGAALAGLTGQVIEWFRHLSQLTATISVGIAMAVLGLVAYLVGSAIKVPTKEAAKLREYERQAKQRQNDAKQAAKARRAQDTSSNAAAPVSPPPPLPSTARKADPDREVEDI